jgi:ribosomal protein S18 acetylase RimI-like enzyme
MKQEIDDFEEIDYFDINNGFIEPCCNTYEGFINLHQIYGKISYYSICGNIIIGKFSLQSSHSEDNYLYFYCFEIYEDFRGNGYGRKFLENLIEVLKLHILPGKIYGNNRYCEGIVLDCDVDNLIAKKL